MSISFWLRVIMICIVVNCCTCTTGKKSSLHYIGDSSNISNVPTPSGFAISPSQAMEIKNSLGISKKIDDFYHDSESYYVCDGFRKVEGGRGSTAAEAKELGTVINGRTGEVYNRVTAQWERDP